MSSPHLLSAVEQAALIRSKGISAVELTQIYLDRIDRFDSALGSYLIVDREGALTQAGAIDTAVAGGQTLGPLAGVPIGLKDILVTKGLRTTAASRILGDWVPPYDATVVAKLRSAGAVLVGKLNMDEFAMGSSNENSSYFPCRNPWDLGRVPGGSSGGSAAAVAAGLCAASLGTDTGGSIRQPAALCGIVGLKPTYGRVSRYGVIAFASSLDQVGPMGRTVADVALLYQAIAGFDARDSTSIDATVEDASEAMAGGGKALVIGRAKELDLPGVDPDVQECTDQAIQKLVDAGAEVREVSLPHAKYALPTYYLIAPAEASSNLARFDGVRYGLRANDDNLDLVEMYERSRGQGFGAEVKRRIMLGTFALRSGYYDAYYQKAQQVRALIARDYARAFEHVDVIASPTSPTTAFALGERSDNPMHMYLADVFTLSCNLAGLPGISVPCGRSSTGLPIGLQLLAGPMAETTLLRAAAQVERVCGPGSLAPDPEHKP